MGNGFRRQLFDERAVYPENLTNYEAVGSVGRYHYGANTHLFSITSEQIALEHRSNELFSKTLRDAAKYVGEKLDELSPTHGATGLSFSVEAIFLRDRNGATGTQFCKSLIDKGPAIRALGSKFDKAFCNFSVSRKPFQFIMRLEPHLSSDGANLYFHSNGYQDVAPNDTIESKLAEMERAKIYHALVLDTLSTSFMGQQK